MYFGGPHTPIFIGVSFVLEFREWIGKENSIDPRLPTFTPRRGGGFIGKLALFPNFLFDPLQQLIHFHFSFLFAPQIEHDFSFSKISRMKKWNLCFDVCILIFKRDGKRGFEGIVRQ